jgi:hypothetical protein
MYTTMPKAHQETRTGVQLHALLGNVVGAKVVGEKSHNAH